MGSSALSLQRPQPTLNADHLKDIDESLRSLSEEVEASDLSNSARERLASILREFREAVEEHDVAGSNPIRSAAEHTVGVIVTDPQLREELNSSGVGKRLWNIVYSVLTALNLVAGPASLPASVDYWMNNVISIESTVEPEVGEIEVAEEPATDDESE